jgi:[ribosomal protein S5]-alanine N-acetyltransferase
VFRMAEQANVSVWLEPPSPGREAEFLAAVQASATFHHPWVYPPDTPALYRAFVLRGTDTRCADHFICAGDGRLAGVANLSEIVRGGFGSTYLGYYALAPHHARGYMEEGIRLVLQRAFGALALHRVEANIQPANERSRSLVRRLGFRLEGFSPRYLKVGGQWCDHERWAITAEEWQARTLQCSWRLRVNPDLTRPAAR